MNDRGVLRDDDDDVVHFEPPAEQVFYVDDVGGPKILEEWVPDEESGDSGSDDE